MRRLVSALAVLLAACGTVSETCKCSAGFVCVYMGANSAPVCHPACPLDGGTCTLAAACTCGASCSGCKDCVSVCPL